LIWKRTLASQMNSAQIDQVSVDIESADRAIGLRATGSVIAFDGFLTLYQEGQDDDGEDEQDRRLPAMSPGQALQLRDVRPSQHFTEPPPRYTEASLVKKLEELGIGRPSTYASIISVLQDRDYVRLEKRRFVPEDRGRVVTSFLENFFGRYVEYGFTADLEDQLDQISAGTIPWRKVLDDFWRAFRAAVEETAHLRVKDVLDALDKALGPHLFPMQADGRDPRICPACADGRLNLKLGKFGPFIGCVNYPECRYTRPLAGDGGDDSAGSIGPKELGADPESGLMVSLRKGPYGHYLQLGGANGEDKTAKPKRVSLPPGLPPDLLDLERAVQLLALPREIGLHPESGKPVQAGIGRFGPYIRHERTFKSLPKDEDVLVIGLNRALTLLAERAARGGGVLRELGLHPEDGAPVALRAGRYGPYVQHNRTNATLAKGTDPESLTLEAALALLAERAKQAPATKRGRGAARKKSDPTKPPVAKKSAAKKKPAAKKAKAKSTTAAKRRAGARQAEPGDV
jgi:DNA topoisomerase-1